MRSHGMHHLVHIWARHNWIAVQFCPDVPADLPQNRIRDRNAGHDVGAARFPSKILLRNTIQQRPANIKVCRLDAGEKFHIERLMIGDDDDAPRSAGKGLARLIELEVCVEAARPDQADQYVRTGMKFCLVGFLGLIGHECGIPAQISAGAADGNIFAVDQSLPIARWRLRQCKLRKNRFSSLSSERCPSRVCAQEEEPKCHGLRHRCDVE